MKKFSMGIMVISMVVLVSLVFLYTGGSEKTSDNMSSFHTISNQSSTSTKNHYENESITFNYPNGWKISKEKVNPPQIVSVEKNKDNVVSVFKEKLDNISFVDRVKEWRNNIASEGKIYYQGTIKVDGFKAYDIQSTYSIGNYSYSSRGIAFERNGVAYFIIFVFKGGLLDHKSEMDLVIKSFHIKKE